MQIIDTTTPICDGRLEIPTYHRGHLSLKTGTEVTTCLLPQRTDQPMPRMREMVVSPIVFGSWRYIARVSAVFYEYPGIVRKLTKALKESKIDLLYEESASIDNGRYHRVEILIDPQQHYHRIKDHIHPDRAVLGSLERRLKAICLGELVFDGSRPRVKGPQNGGTSGCMV